MLRRFVPPAAIALVLPLAVAPAAAAEQGPVLHPDGMFAFGETAVLSYPAGAYPHEYDWEDMREVGFTIDGVERDPADPETVHYRLTVDVPELGRVFGMAGVEPYCAVAGNPTGSPASLPGSVELEPGAHTYDLQCTVPEMFVHVEILFTRTDAEGEEILILSHGSPQG